MRKNLKIITLIFTCLAVSSCFRISSFKAPEVKYENWREAKTTSKVQLDRNWWKNFGDEKLEKIIDLAVINSPDLEIALARINEGRAQEHGVIASDLPVIEAGVSAGRSRSSTTLTSRSISQKYSNSYKAEFDASWEISLFSIEPALRAASENTKKLQEDYNNVLITLYGDVASNYFEVRKLQLQLSTASQKVQNLEEKLQLQKSLFAGGKINGMEYSQTEVEYSKTKTLLENYLVALKLQKYKLELLVGVNPAELDSLINDTFHYSIPSPDFVLNAPADTLRNRPDVRSAELNLAYSASVKDVAYSNLLPHISISSLLGFETGNSSRLFNSASQAWGATGGILTPIFDYKKLRADILSADSKKQEALATYQKSVLTALSDVESSFASFNSARRNYDISAKQLSSSADEEYLMQQRYNKGLSSYIDLIDVKSRKADDEINYESAKFENLIQLVRVYKSLGGGWQ